MEIFNKSPKNRVKTLVEEFLKKKEAKTIEERLEKEYPDSLILKYGKNLPNPKKLVKTKEEENLFPSAEKYDIGEGINVFVEKTSKKRRVQLSVEDVQKALAYVPLTHLKTENLTLLKIVSKNIFSDEDEENLMGRNVLGAYDDNNAIVIVYSFTSLTFEITIEKPKIKKMLQNTVRHEIGHHFYTQFFQKNYDITVKEEWKKTVKGLDEEEEFAKTYAEFWYPEGRKKMKKKSTKKYEFMKKLFL